MAENIRIVSGLVNSDATIAGGNGFDVIRSGQGLYLIIIDDHFGTLPAVSVLLNPSGSDISSGDGDSEWGHCVLVGVSNGQIKIKIFDKDGVPENMSFTFIATG